MGTYQEYEDQHNDKGYCHCLVEVSCFIYVMCIYLHMMVSITFPLLKDAYTQSRKLYENRISSWYGALQQI